VPRTDGHEGTLRACLGEAGDLVSPGTCQTAWSGSSLGWQPRPAAEMVVDRAESLIDWKAI
jgi:hypothetical protein